jgi:4-hydroxy-3-polyprenylbenzoate decarboxylase
MEVIVGITGATGVLYAVRLLEALGDIGVIVHLVISEWGKRNLEIETPYDLGDVEKLAPFVYEDGDLGAPISSGSYRTDGMIVLPCSMKTLGAVAGGYDENLIARAAGVTLKEGRKLVLCPRETPLSAIHLENMLKLARLGVRIVPPMPAFYNRPTNIEDIIDTHTMKVLDQFGISLGDQKRWNGSSTINAD